MTVMRSSSLGRRMATSVAYAWRRMRLRSCRVTTPFARRAWRRGRRRAALRVRFVAEVWGGASTAGRRWRVQRRTSTLRQRSGRRCCTWPRSAASSLRCDDAEVFVLLQVNLKQPLGWLLPVWLTKWRVAACRPNIVKINPLQTKV
jgi:hypothetical protein